MIAAYLGRHRSQPFIRLLRDDARRFASSKAFDMQRDAIDP